MAPRLLASAAALILLAAGATPSVGSTARPAPSRSDGCGARAETVLQVLGSGGPMHGGARGSAAYLVWHAGRPVAVVDMGGDTARALAQAGVKPAEVEAVLLTHLHPDHASGLPDFLWGEMVAERSSPLAIVGPSGASDFPDIETFLQRQFGPAGAFPEMKALLGTDGFRLDRRTAPIDAEGPRLVFKRGGISVSAYPVPHGRKPALAYRIDTPTASLVFGGDQTAQAPGFSRFAQGADLLVLHAIITDEARDTQLAQVVGLPGSLAARAKEADAKRLLLGHLMGLQASGKAQRQWSLSALDDVVRSVRAGFSGPVLVAEDQQCLPL